MKRASKALLCAAMAAALALSVALCGCSGGSAASSAPKEPLNLAGEWKQVNSNSADSWQAATITDNTITIYWVSNGGDTKSLYWAGSYDAPTEAAETYAWTSNNDKEQTDKALLASSADTKDFKYENKQLSYEASALGTTMTVRMEKQ